MPAFWSAFLPLFVAVDVVGVLPVYLGFVAALDEPARRRIVLDATLTAAGVGGGFLFLGDAILAVVGVSVGDFQVAGGLLLLVLAIYDLLHPELPLRQPGVHLGVVPLGTPLIAGPAVLTTLLTIARTLGISPGAFGFWAKSGAGLGGAALGIPYRPSHRRSRRASGGQSLRAPLGGDRRHFGASRRGAGASGSVAWTTPRVELTCIAHRRSRREDIMGQMFSSLF